MTREGIVERLVIRDRCGLDSDGASAQGRSLIDKVVSEIQSLSRRRYCYCSTVTRLEERRRNLKNAGVMNKRTLRSLISAENQLERHVGELIPAIDQQLAEHRALLTSLTGT